MSAPRWSGRGRELWEQPRANRQRYHWQIPVLDDGTGVHVPIVMIAGQAGGSRVALVAGVHGDEIEGQFVLQDLAQSLDPGVLHGTLALVLCANPLAAEHGQRCTPADGMDLNRVFPGDPEGSVSQRLAASLFDLVGRADCLMTLHSWYAAGEVLPYVEYPDGASPVAEASLHAARASGLGRIMALDWHPGLLPAAAVREGISSIEVEIGGRGESRSANRTLYRETVLNVLRGWGVLPGAPQPMPNIRNIRAHHLLASTAGTLRLCVELGQTVQVNERLASIVGLDGQTENELPAPASGEIGALRRFAPVQEGDHVAAIFEEVGS